MRLRFQLIIPGREHQPNGLYVPEMPQVLSSSEKIQEVKEHTKASFLVLFFKFHSLK